MQAWRPTTARPTAIDSIMLLVAVGFGLGMAFLVVPPPDVSDAYADWLFSSAVVDGLDPYQTMSELSSHYGIVYDVEVAHPRPPGAAVPMAPLGLISPEQVRGFNNALNVLAVVFVLWVAAGRLGLPVAVYLLADTSFYQWANHMFWIGALIILAIVSRSPLRGGLLLGIAGAIKLWPIAIVAGFWATRDRKRASVAVAAFMILTLVGALVINTTLLSAIEAMGDTSRLFVWSRSNGSPTSVAIRMGAPFGVAAATSVIVGALWWVRHRTVEASIVTAFIVTPLVWSGYQLVMAPFVAERLRRREATALAILVVFLIQGYSGWWRLMITGLMMVAIELKPDSTRWRPMSEIEAVEVVDG